MFRFSPFKLHETEIDSFVAINLDVSRERDALRIVCSSADKRLICCDIFHGGANSLDEIQEIWSRDTGSRAWHLFTSPVQAGTSRSPALVYAGRDDGNFHAYTTGGVPAWSHKFTATISEFCPYQDPKTLQSLLLVPSLDKTLRLLDASSGQLIWGDTFQSGVNIARPLDGLFENIHVLVAGGNDSTLRCYTRDIDASQPKDYKMAWFHKFGSYIRDVGVSSSGIVAGVADDGFLKVLDVKSGQPEWVHEHNSFAWKCKVLDSIGVIVSSSFQVPIMVDETGEKLGNPGMIACHSLAGDLLWETSPEDGLNVNCWDFCTWNGQEFMVVGTTAGNVAIVDVKNGRVIQRHECGNLVNQVAFVTVRGKNGGRNPLYLMACCERKEESVMVAVSD